MKKSKITRKCSPKGGLTIAQLVNGYKSSQPQRIVVELKDGRSELLTLKSFRPMRFNPTGRGTTKYLTMSSEKPHFLEVREMKKDDVQKLRRMGYTVQVMGDASAVSGVPSLLQTIKQRGIITATGRIHLVESVTRRSGVRRQHGNGYRSQISRGGSGGFAGGGHGGGRHFHFGGGGGGSYNRVSERTFLVAILTSDEKQREELKKVLAQLDEKDAKIRKRLHEITTEEDDELREPDPKKKVFRSDIKDNMMADALYEVYEKTLGDSAEAKKHKYDFSPIDLIAFLFIMVDLYHYGRDDFHRNGKRPFFEFFIEKVRPELKNKRGITRETMGNRIRKDFDCLYLSPKDKESLPKGVKTLAKSIESNFQAVCGIFHKTRLGGILE